MGRQHTTWISDDTWERLKNIGGDSISKKISNAVKAADPDEQMLTRAKMRQLERAKEVLREISRDVQSTNVDVLEDIADRIEEVWFLWEAQ